LATDLTKVVKWRVSGAGAHDGEYEPSSIQPSSINAGKTIFLRNLEPTRYLFFDGSNWVIGGDYTKKRGWVQGPGQELGQIEKWQMNDSPDRSWRVHENIKVLADFGNPQQSCQPMVQWVNWKLQGMRQQNSELVEDARWGDSTLKSLQKVSKIETIESMTLNTVPIENWDRFSQRLVRKLVRDGASHPEEVLTNALQEVQDSNDSLHRQFDLSLNYEFGGSQYMSCIKFAARKKRSGDIVICYSLFGKRWVEQEQYALNREFWEKSPVPERMQAFLEHGANEGFIKALETSSVREALCED